MFLDLIQLLDGELVSAQVLFRLLLGRLMIHQDAPTSESKGELRGRRLGHVPFHMTIFLCGSWYCPANTRYVVRIAFRKLLWALEAIHVALKVAAVLPRL